MESVLYLVHRLPFPPNKGDKVRSYHLLKHLLSQYRVHLGTFVDDPQDQAYLPRLEKLCASLCARALNPRRAKVNSLKGLLTGEPLTLAYYRDAALQSWVNQVCREHAIRRVVVFSSSMAQYVEELAEDVSVLVDFVDLDSAKWTAYADSHRWPMSWLYRREGIKLLAYERYVAQRAAHSYFVTEQETELFRQRAPESADRVSAVCNGVDAEFFAPDTQRPNPYPADRRVVVFTGAMDYLPNIDAVEWFVRDIFPVLRQSYPDLLFYVVGRSPTPEVLALAGPEVCVTGTVDDVRPYLQHAAAVVAPLRIARGIQNKILEAMAMAQAVVAARTCTAVLDAESAQAVMAAEAGAEYVQHLSRLLDDPAHGKLLGQHARACVLRHYSWEAHLSAIHWDSGE